MFPLVSVLGKKTLFLFKPQTLFPLKSIQTFNFSCPLVGVGGQGKNHLWGCDMISADVMKWVSEVGWIIRLAALVSGGFIAGRFVCDHVTAPPYDYKQLWLDDAVRVCETAGVTVVVSVSFSVCPCSLCMCAIIVRVPSHWLSTSCSLIVIVSRCLIISECPPPTRPPTPPGQTQQLYSDTCAAWMASCVTLSASLLRLHICSIHSCTAPWALHSGPSLQLLSVLFQLFCCRFAAVIGSLSCSCGTYLTLLRYTEEFTVHSSPCSQLVWGVGFDKRLLCGLVCSSSLVLCSDEALQT